MQIESQISTSQEYYKSNYAKNLEAVNKLKKVLSKNSKGGGEKATLRQKKLKKLTARQRISLLIDEGSDFLELSPLAALDTYESSVPCAGIITGIAKIENRLCMIIANDQTVKGGCYYPLTVKKHLRAQKIAQKNKLPCIYLVDSGGAFLPKQAEVFPDVQHFGRIFFNQAQMSAMGIAQISAVFGFCTAGGAYIPAMSDQTMIVKKTGTIFLGGPPLVKAATGEEISAEELGGALIHTQKSGVADHLAESEEHALYILRNIVKYLGPYNAAQIKLQAPSDPLFDSDELLGVMSKDLSKPIDVKEIISRLVDDSKLFEFKKEFAPTLVCGFSHMNGIPIGIIANNGILFSDSALKGTHFIELCCQEKIPLLFIQNISGFMIGKQYEHEGIAKHGAKLVHAVANANIPKITLIIGGSFGAGNYGMCGRAFDPDFLFMWPWARISVMGGEQAARVLTTVKEEQFKKEGKAFSETTKKSIQDEILSKYNTEGHAFYSSSQLWDDGVIDPRETRRYLSLALAATIQNQREESRFGIFRM